MRSRMDHVYFSRSLLSDIIIDNNDNIYIYLTSAINVEALVSKSSSKPSLEKILFIGLKEALLAGTKHPI